ncbi:hypothetical protein [Paenibacillus dendritiformis]|uniref:hypothetical protein n=1 Tax=Paenibacillus dendritiformis TaxID=130049 RepID=UPI0018CE2876|nr:hypothetical protein [Paenibacillus dendritiformis]
MVEQAAGKPRMAEQAAASCVLAEQITASHVWAEAGCGNRSTDGACPRTGPASLPQSLRPEGKR